MKYFKILLLSLTLFSCKDDINDISKHNENWIWWKSIDDNEGAWLIRDNNAQNKLMNGFFTTWHPNGVKESEGNVKEGLRMDTCRYWHSEAHLWLEAFYKNDTIIGKYVAYEKSDTIKGYLKIVSTKRQGIKVDTSKYYYDDDALFALVPYRLGIKHGQEQQFYRTGELLSTVNYRNGKRHGQWKVWYKNGNLLYFEESENGQAQGLAKHWFDNGILQSSENFVADIRQGNGEKYYKNGKLKISKYWEHGKAEGLWKFYNNEGKLDSTVRYHNGYFQEVTKGDS